MVAVAGDGWRKGIGAQSLTLKPDFFKMLGCALGLENYSEEVLQVGQ